MHSCSCQINNQKNLIHISISFSALVFMFVMFHQSSRSQIAYFRASHVEPRASSTISTDHNQKFESKHRVHLHGDQETVLEFQVWVSLWSRQPGGVPQHVLKILPYWWWEGGRCKIWSTFKLFNTSANLSSYSDYIFYAMDHQKTGTINFEVKKHIPTSSVTKMSKCHVSMSACRWLTIPEHSNINIYRSLQCNVWNKKSGFSIFNISKHWTY